VKRDPVPVRVSVWAFATCLVVFPREFRARFGDPMTEAFTAAASDRWQSGGSSSLVRLWLQTFPDLLVEGLRERRAARSATDRWLAVAAIRQQPLPRRAPIMDSLLRDLTFALRTLRRARGFTLAVVATIALGIGANTAIFTILDGIALRPLPFANSERVVSLCETHVQVGDYCIGSPPQVADFADLSDSLVDAGVARTWSFTMRDDEGSVAIPTGIATPGYLRVQGLEPQLGRLFDESELVDGANRVVVLTHGFWQARLGGDPDIVGRQLIFGETPYTVVGVLAQDAWMHRFAWVQMWAPLTVTPEQTDNRDWRGFVSLGLLAEGTTLEQAREELEGVRLGLEQAYPDTNAGWGLRVDRLRDRVAGPVRPMLLLFLGAVGFVLLIGCANVANLLLVRSTERTGEFAVRASLGAGRGRLLRQLLTESLVLSLLGGVAGFVLAGLVTEAFLALAPGNIPRLDEVGLDLRVFGFALLLSMTTAVVFGLVPAWRAARTDVNETLKSTRHGDARSGGLRSALVVAEMALALMLLLGAGLLARSFTTLLDWDPGFDRTNLVTISALADFSRFDTGPQIVQAFDDIGEAIGAVPGVEAVGQTSAGPLFGGRETGGLAIAGREVPLPEDQISVRWYDIDPHYFGAMGIALVRGRGFADTDDAASVPVAIVNETMVRRFFPEEDPLGQRVTVEEHEAQIVGVVQDVRPFLPNQATGPEIFWPRRQFPRGATFFVVRSGLPLTSLREQVLEGAGQAAPDVRLSRFRPLEEWAGMELVEPRFRVALVAAFALVAVLLSAIGTYGVIAYTVASRTHEIGVRMALGAHPGVITRGVVRSGVRLALIGIAMGVLGGLLLGRTLASMLYGMPAGDPATYVAASAVFLVVAALASWLPARRASRVDPMRALRVE
jgi:predicted permease